MIKNNYKSYFIIVLAAVAILAYNSFFIVSEVSQAIVLQFGKPVEFNEDGKKLEYITSPGLKFKIPFIQEVVIFDKRILNFKVNDKEVLDSENKAITVNAFAKYKITNPLLFYQKVTNEQGVNNKLDNIFQASLRKVIGTATIKTLLTEERKNIMSKIEDDVDNEGRDFGIEILDVRIVRVDLPKENSEAIFKRMYTDRNKEAREYRAQGNEEAQKIRSKAIKEATVIRSQGEKQAEIIRGEGDAKATKIFAEAFGKDPEFFAFYRSMKAYRTSMSKDDTTMVLSPDSEFMKYFKQNNVVK